MDFTVTDCNFPLCKIMCFTSNHPKIGLSSPKKDIGSIRGPSLRYFRIVSAKYTKGLTQQPWVRWFYIVWVFSPSCMPKNLAHLFFAYLSTELDF
jgi:hypothetical protein